MHQPSPSPSSPASSFRQPWANELPDHMTHHGPTEAGPLISSALKASARRSDGFELNYAWCEQVPHALVRAGPSHDQILPSLDAWPGGSETADLAYHAADPAIDPLARINGSPPHATPGGYGTAHVLSEHLGAADNYQQDANNLTGDILQLTDLADPEFGVHAPNLFNMLDGNNFLNDQSQAGQINPSHRVGLSAQPSFQTNLNMPTFALPSVSPFQQRTNCPWLGCTESFARFTDIQRHWDSVHLGIRYHCFWVGCPNNAGKGYCRLEKLRTHQKQKHGFALV